MEHVCPPHPEADFLWSCQGLAWAFPDRKLGQYPGCKILGGRKPLARPDRPYTPEELLAFENVEQNTPLWHDMRTKFVGASEFSNLLGLNAYALPADFMNKLAGRIDTRRESDKKLVFDLGHHFEPVAADRFTKFMADQENLPIELHELGILVDNEHRLLSASIDRVCFDMKGECVNVEIKCPARKRYGGVFPADYMCQTQQQMRIAQMQRVSPHSEQLRRITETFLVALYIPYRELDDMNRTATVDDTEPAVLDLYHVEYNQPWWDQFAWPRVNAFFDAYFQGETNYHIPQGLLPAPDLDEEHLGEFEVGCINETVLKFQ